MIALRETIEAAAKGGSRALVLSGTPGRFSGGLDVPVLLGYDRTAIGELWHEFYALLKALAASPIPIAADESALGLDDLPGLVGRFDVINIKLDKCGGLTEGLALARKARRLGLDVMVGNMLGTSLAMAPACLVGQLCEIVDLDGPLFFKGDRSIAASYDGGSITCPLELWGNP